MYAMTVFHLIILLCYTFSNGITSFIISHEAEPECERNRKSWFSLSTEERQLFAEGFQLIRDNGKLEVIANAHSTNYMEQIHQSSLFLYYHSYLIWETETAIRDLGGKFSCFGMPWYDWTRERQYTTMNTNPSIFDTGIGGDGNPENNYCVANDWGLNRYTTPNLCAENETPPNCCLKRAKSDTEEVIDTKTALEGLRFPNVEDFENTIRPSHAGFHRYFGSLEIAHLDTGYGPDDPIFHIAHSYMDLMRLLWQHCHHYEIIEDPPYEMYHPYCYDIDDYDGDADTPCSVIEPFIGLDDSLQFLALPDVDWSIVGKGHTVTVHQILHLKRHFNVNYDLVDIIDSEYPEIKTWCIVDTEVEFDQTWSIATAKSLYSISIYHVAVALLMMLLICANFCYFNRRRDPSKNLKWEHDKNLQYGSFDML